MSLLPAEMLDAGARCGALLRERGETVAVAEGSAGGLVSTALLAVPGASEPWALHLARASRIHLRATWGIGEGGATGPSGNPYGDPPGHAWVAVSGPSEVAPRLITGRREPTPSQPWLAIDERCWAIHRRSASLFVRAIDRS